MGPFFSGFAITFVITIFLIIFLRFIISYIPKLLGSKPITYKSVKESTEWLNFLLDKINQHFQNENSIKEFNSFITSKIHPYQLRLLSLGNSPVISYVATLEMQEADDIRLLIPIDWKNGPSFDLITSSKLIKYEIDLFHFTGQVLVSWPGSSASRLEVRFVGNSCIDFDLSIQLLNFIHFSLTNIPLVGEIVKGIVASYIAKQVFYLYLPKPNFNSSSDVYNLPVN